MVASKWGGACRQRPQSVGPGAWTDFLAEVMTVVSAVDSTAVSAGVVEEIAAEVALKPVVEAATDLDATPANGKAQRQQ